MKEDLISRQVAIDEISRWLGYLDDDMISRIQLGLMRLPSAQPEIVRCKDCLYGEQDEIGRWFCRSFGCQVGDENGNGFCADGERKDGKQDG